jgi:hypothetical protein
VASLAFRYTYLVDQQLLVVMAPSDLHEDTIHAIEDALNVYINRIRKIIGTNEFRDMFVLGLNTSTLYQDFLDEFLADLTLSMDVIPLFHLEVAFMQRLKLLLDKVDRMLTNDSTWGVLVVQIKESSVWEMFDEAPMDGDDMSYNTWVQQCQRTDGFGGITVGGRTWIGDVTCEVYLFPSDWDRTQGLPQSVSLPFMLQFRLD